jgi:hypothetical protein
MDDGRNQETIAAHIESVSSRSASDTDRLASRIARSCWPGGAGDRLEPAALEWVRRWRPRGPIVGAIACACASGRCQVCN